LAFDQIKDQPSGGSKEFETFQYRIGLQLVSNVGRIMHFESFTQRFGLLVHFGVQQSNLLVKLDGLDTKSGDSEKIGELLWGLLLNFV